MNNVNTINAINVYKAILTIEKYLLNYSFHFTDSNLMTYKINGTSVQCIFTNDIMTVNHFSTGCVVYYTNRRQPVLVYAMRDNDDSSVTVKITDINSTGAYNISIMPLPFPVQYLSLNIIASKF